MPGEQDPAVENKIRFAVVVSHPIPYYTPVYRVLAQRAGFDVKAFFATRLGVDETLDPGMGIELAWKTDLFGGYEHVFLSNTGSIKRWSFRAADNPNVGKFLDEFAPDVVLIHGYTQITMLRALLWCRRNNVPALMVSDSSLHSDTGWLMRGLKRILLPIVFRQFSAFLSIGDTNQKYLETFGVPSERIFRVPNSVDEGFWARRETRQQTRVRVRARLGVSDQDLVVLYVGKLIARKRPGDLVAALAQLRSIPAAGRAIRVLFAGDGAQRSALESEVAAAKLPAQFLGFVNIDSLPDYYCAADALAHPAEKEVFGVIVIEAAILGLPLILSDHVGAIGPTSIARPGENALTYPCGDIGSLAAALHRLACEPETLVRLGEASLRISKELDSRKSVSGTLDAVDYCLAGRRRSVRRHVVSSF